MPGLKPRKTDLTNVRCYAIQDQTAEYMINLVKQAEQTHTLFVFLFHGVGGGHAINQLGRAYGAAPIPEGPRKENVDRPRQEVAQTSVPCGNGKTPSPGTGEKPTWRQRIKALSNLPAFFRLVWETSPWMTVADGGVRVIRSAIPVCILYIGKLIIDLVVQLSRHPGSFHKERIWELVAIEFGLAIVSDALGRLTNLLDSLLGDLFANHTTVLIMEHAAILDLDQFEDSNFYDKLERARQQTTGRTVLLSQVLGSGRT